MLHTRTLIRWLVLQVVGMMVVVAPLKAQTVKQGDAKDVVDPNEFHSPMVIETVFAPADPALWRDENWTPGKPKPWGRGEFTTAEYYDLGKYTCDGLSIHDGNRDGTWYSGLVMEVKNKGGDVHVTIKAQVTNPGHIHDKFVTLLFEVINGDDVVGKTTIGLKVKQNWRAKKEVTDKESTLVLPASALRKDPLTKLRITMTTQDY
jgi:hypothetical protein